MKLYYADSYVTIYLGDSREILPSLPDLSVDLVLSSPPYYAQRQHTDDARELGTEATPQEYLASLLEITGALLRHLDPNGSIVMNLGDKYQADGPIKDVSTKAGYPRARRQPRWPGLSLKSLMMLPSRYAIGCTDQLGLALRSEIIWDKGSGGSDGKAHDRVRRSHEVLYQFTRALKHGESTGCWEHPGSSVWKIPPNRSRNGHSADYPLELASRCIRSWSPPNGLVLDPFMGSGTTLRAARLLGRRSIGIDISEEFCALAVHLLSSLS